MRSCNRNINVKRSCDIKRDIKIRRNRDSKSTSECTGNKCRCIAINLNMKMTLAAHYNMGVKPPTNRNRRGDRRTLILTHICIVIVRVRVLRLPIMSGRNRNRNI